MTIPEQPLYLIEASDGNRVEMCVVYANNAHNAKTSAATWLSARQDLPLVNVRGFPDGLAVYFAGNHWFTFPGVFGIPTTDGDDNNASRRDSTQDTTEGSNDGK